jgi:uncharacterized protein YoxC
MAPDVIGLALWPARAARRLMENEVSTPLEDTEKDVLDALTAIHRATDSIEHHVEVIEVLATSVKPLTDSVDQLPATVRDLVALLGPMAAAERGVAHAEQDVVKAERFFEFHRHKAGAAATSDQNSEQPRPPPRGETPAQR